MLFRLFLIPFLLPTVLFSLGARAGFNCLDRLIPPAVPFTSPRIATEDFAFRAALPQTEVPKDQWKTCCGQFGPCAMTYPAVIFPDGIVGVEKLKWSQERVLAAAKNLIGLPYRHFHFPEMGGLDCSNFTAWVYNYALGIRFNSTVQKQALEAGRLLKPDEPLQAGDLIYLWDAHRVEIAHVALYIDALTVIDSTGPGVEIRPFEGWYKGNLAWVRRVLE